MSSLVAICLVLACVCAKCVPWDGRGIRQVAPIPKVETTPDSMSSQPLVTFLDPVQHHLRELVRFGQMRVDSDEAFRIGLEPVRHRTDAPVIGSHIIGDWNDALLLARPTVRLRFLQVQQQL